MSLSDVMSAMRLEVYAEAGLLIFLLVFLAVCVRLAFFSSREELDQAARIPLEESGPFPPTPKSPTP
ncbi:MAG: hypothetical protein RJA70_1279 [Pseudomonadota bacterium]|jgi:cbb3-type cytochrome oxidase subunit 3